MDQLFNFPQSPKERTDFWIALIVCFIALSIVGWYAVQSSRPETLTVAKTEATTSSELESVFNSPIKTPEITSELPAKNVKSTLVKAKPNTISEIYTTTTLPKEEVKVNTKNVNQNEIGSFETAGTIEKLAAQSEKELKEKEALYESNKNSEAATEIAKLEKEIKDLETKVSFEEGKLTEKKTQHRNAKTNQFGDCKIIIGAFSIESNQQKLIQKLKADGYRTFETPFRGLTRVGIYHACNSEDLNNTLDKIKREFASDAMILK